MGHVILLAGSWGFQNGFPAMRLKFQRADFFATRDQLGGVHAVAARDGRATSTGTLTDRTSVL